MSTPLRAVQYVRMSTEHQRYSIENQQAALGEYAEMEGFEVVRTYADAGKSGLQLKGRRQLQQLLSDCLNPDRDFDVILVLDVSRWGRFQDPDAAAYYEYTCRGAGVRVIYVAETFDNDGGIVSSIVKHLKRVMAAEYSRELSAKILQAQLRQAKLGFRQGGPTPFGFRRALIGPDGQFLRCLDRGERKAITGDRIRLVPGDAAEVREVRNIFRWFVRERLSFTGIAERLQARGVRPAGRSGRWTVRAITTILRDEIYRGNYVFNRTTQQLRSKRQPVPPEEWIRVPVVEPLIGPRTFAAAQGLAARGHHNRYSDRQLLDGLRRLLAREGRLTYKLVAAAKDLPDWTTYKQRFGSLREAFRQIGYTQLRAPTPRVRTWSEAEAIEELRRVQAKYGYVTAWVLRCDPRAPGPDYYRRMFGSLVEAYARAGIAHSPREAIRAGFRRRRENTAAFPSQLHSRLRGGLHTAPIGS